MSILTLAYPAQAAVATVAQTFSGALRSVLGIGILSLVAALAVVFKPLMTGLRQIGRLAVHPRMSDHERSLVQQWEGAQLLNHLAKEAEATQPNLAAEMRYLAARG
jgi:hypothetical protein